MTKRAGSPGKDLSAVLTLSACASNWTNHASLLAGLS
jgi:hypothetical protein